MPRRRKPSKDQDTEALLVLKDKFNDSASLLIDQLIALKRGINGRGDSSYGIPPGKINEPLPSKVPQTLTEVVSNYKFLSDLGLEIIHRQETLSKRNKNASLEFLVAEGTSAISRGLFKAKSLFNTSPDVKASRDILNLLNQLRLLNIDFQDESVTSSNDSSKLTDFYSEMLKLTGGINRIYVNSGVNSDNKNDFYGMENIDPSESKLKFYEREFSAADIIGVKKYKSKFTMLVQQFKKSGEIDRNMVMEQIDALYKDLYNSLKEKYTNVEWKTINDLSTLVPSFSVEEEEKHNKDSKQDQENIEKYREKLSFLDTEFVMAEILGFKKYKPSFKQLESLFYRTDNHEQVMNQMESLYQKLLQEAKLKYGQVKFDNLSDLASKVNELKTSNQINQMEVMAHNAMTRFIKKKLLDYSLSDPTSSTRVNLFDKCKDLNVMIGSLMNSIERFDNLKNQLSIWENIKKSISDIKTIYQTLIFLIQNKKQPAKLPAPKSSSKIASIYLAHEERTAYVLAKTVEVFGSLDKAHQWLKKPNRALGQIPLCMLDTDIGTTVVLNELGRIEYGVFG